MRISIQELVLPPIYIFQMGKVGSASLHSTLSQKYKGKVIHAHTYETMAPQAKQVLKWRKRFYLPVYVICPVREPLSRNVSAFFQNFKRDTNYDFSERLWTASELCQLFLENYPHNVCLEWFDNDFRKTFQVDVFAKPFPIHRKWETYRRSSVHVLVYRADLEHTEQLNVISRFIGFKIESWNYSNRSEDKEYRDAYQSFYNSVKLPDVYVSIMCKSRFCRHFWSDEEIAAFSKKWIA